MAGCVLKTTKHIDSLELQALIEKAYKLGKHEFTITYDDDLTAFINIDSYLDKGAGLALDIDKRKMTARLSLYPPLNFGGNLDLESLEDFLLDERKLDNELIDWDKFNDCFQKYMEGHIIHQEVICTGIEKIDGDDAQFDLQFEMEEKKPKELADGSVDFKDINNIIMVKEGEDLIRYVPETDGTDGKTVYGDPIPAKKGKKVTIIKGNGVDYNEETNMFYSTLAGHVTFNNRKINVNSIYAVNGDVDFSEGNVEFHGTVTISGDVLSGFQVKGKNIIVRGIARDATLIAEEDITVRAGIFSTGKGVTKAGNSVMANFIEGAEVYAGIAVVVRDYCYNAKVFCEGEILALSGDGIINGGELHAFSSIEAKQIGKPNSGAFTIHVGVKHFLNERIEQLIDQKDKLEKTLKQTDKKIKSMAKVNPVLKEKEQLRTIITHRATLFKKYEGIDGEIEDLIKKSLHPMPYVLAKDSICEGVKIVIFNTEHITTGSKSGGKFVFNQSTGHVITVSPDASLEYDPRKGR